jgi:hypothetical protein
MDRTMSGEILNPIRGRNSKTKLLCLILNSHASRNEGDTLRNASLGDFVVVRTS